MTTIVVIAKEPVPGRAKTRLHPPLSLDDAAAVAAACLRDTLDTVRALPVDRRVIALEGQVPDEWTRGFEIQPQAAGGLDERLAAIFDTIDGPTLLIGMDTPQASVSELGPALRTWSDSVDAWFGPAEDGGFWAIGFRRPAGDLIRGVPMSRDDTGRIQLARMRDAGLRIGILPALTDVDTIDSARVVAAATPSSRLARTLGSFDLEVAS